MSPLSESDGSDAVRQRGKVAPSGIGGVDDVIDAVEDGVGQPVGAQELPDILDRVQFGSAGRQEDQADIAGQLQLVGGMPSCAIEQHDGVGNAGDATRELPRCAVACWPCR